MHRAETLLFLAVFVFWTGGCGLLEDTALSDGGGNAGAEGTSLPDSITALSYNVAGLPQGLSSGNPAANIPIISPLLNAHNLVLVQEDFAFQDQLRAETTHEFVSPKHAGLQSGGLNRFARFPFEDYQRIAWTQCNGRLDSGNDCLAPKGFSLARTRIATDLWVYVYNVHMDAGSSSGDVTARGAQVTQLVEHLNAHPDLAAIVVGDTNLNTQNAEDRATLRRLVDGAGLTDTCAAASCSDPDRIDRVFVRNGAGLVWSIVAWSLDERFVDSAGQDLSDHKAVAVELAWSSD